MRTVITDRDLVAMDNALYAKRPESEKVLDTLAARMDALPIPLPERREEAEESMAQPRPYVAWITPASGISQRLSIAPVSSKTEAQQLATLAGQRMFPGQRFQSSVWVDTARGAA